MSITIRHAVPGDLQSVIAVEDVCFPPREAASAQSLKKRLAAYKTCFFVAEIDGKIVGYINGSALDTNEITDEMFENIALHNENGKWQSIFGLDVVPECRRQGIAEALMKKMIEQAKKSGKKGLFLDCKEHLLSYYEKFGYKKVGLSKSVLGGSVWYDMVLTF